MRTDKTGSTNDEEMDKTPRTPQARTYLHTIPPPQETGSMATTYTLQSSKPSGCTFVLAYNDENQITALCGPLDQSEQEYAASHMHYAPSFDFEPVDSMTNTTNWHPPMAEYVDE
jgi:hypothetical protein